MGSEIPPHGSMSGLLLRYFYQRSWVTFIGTPVLATWATFTLFGQTGSWLEVLPTLAGVFWALALYAHGAIYTFYTPVLQDRDHDKALTDYFIAITNGNYHLLPLRLAIHAPIHRWRASYLKAHVFIALACVGVSALSVLVYENKTPGIFPALNIIVYLISSLYLQRKAATAAKQYA